MPQKHLRDLLGEDQEPFLLNSHIADRRSFLISRKPPVRTQLQPRKPSQASVSSIFSGKLRKGSCFSASPDSPDPGKSSPRFNYLRSPKSPDPVFLHVPAKTAALLLEAALRIQRNSASNKPTTKSSSGVLPGFRLFGSLLKRLTRRSESEKARQDSRTSECACSDTDSERHCSSSGFQAELISDFEEEDDDEKFCESPFRFVLQRSPPSGHRTPEITWPPASCPIRHDLKDKDDDEEEEEEEKEQCSPVCVLDPPFEDEEEEVDDEAREHGVGGKDRFDYENSFAIVQKAKQQLLRKLFRFEKLAELDPVELEKRLLDQDSEDDDGSEYAVFSVEEEPVSSSQEEDKVLIKEMHKKRCFEDVTRGVCKRLELWKDADFKRIDITVEQDLRNDRDGWIERDGEQAEDAAREIEAVIFGLMLEELMEELI